MRDWLTVHDIPFPEHALKQELHALIRTSNPTQKYAVDEMAKAAGHEVVRLPPYHCEFNPIELAWSQVKTHIKKNNKLFTLTHVKELTYKGFELVDAENWGKLIDHVKRQFEDKYWEVDGLQEEAMEGFIIRVGGSDDDTSSSSSESDESSGESENG